MKALHTCSLTLHQSINILYTCSPSSHAFVHLYNLLTVLVTLHSLTKPSIYVYIPENHTDLSAN